MNWFCVLFGLCILSFTVAGKQISVKFRDERRTMQAFPTMSWGGIWDGSYFRTFDRFLDDHFFLRPLLIKLSFEGNRILKKTRHDLVAGKDGYFLYRAIADLYTPEKVAIFPYARWHAALDGMNRIAQRDRKKFIFQNFQNKEYHYRDKLPSVWRVVENIEDLPMRKVSHYAETLGIKTLVNTEDFIKLREEGHLVYSPFEENHPSPEAFFFSIKRLLSALSQITGVALDIPQDFPKVPAAAFDEGAYMTAFHEYPTWSFDTPWTKVTAVENSPGLLPGMIYRYENSNEAPLPRTVVYSDSFMLVTMEQFGKILLPYFKSFTLHKYDTDLEGYDQAEILIVSSSDQNQETVLLRMEALIKQLEFERQIH